MAKLNATDLSNIKHALRLSIQFMRDHTDGRDPVRTFLWMNRMAYTLKKLEGGEEKKEDQKLLN